MKDLRKLENLNKFAEMFGIESEYPAGHPKRNLTVVLGNRKISAVKHSLEKTILLNFVTCPRYFIQGCLRN